MEISHVLLRYCLQVNSIIVCANERIPKRARESAFLGIVHLHIYNTVYPLRSIQAFTSIISSEWNTMIGMPVSRLKERYR